MKEQNYQEIRTSEPVVEGQLHEFMDSEKLHMYVSTHPLMVDERVVKAAEICGIPLEWDDEGRINNISFIQAKKLMKQLGAHWLSPSEYWQAYSEALEKKDRVLLHQFQSHEFAEWLDVVYEKDEKGRIFMIEHPEIEENDGKLIVQGERIRIDVPMGRPAWFHPENNINAKSGLPIHVEPKKIKEAAQWSQTTWKYWSFYNLAPGIYVSPIRGYVMSSGTPSLDLDIPFYAQEPVLMVRECRNELPSPPLPEELIQEAQSWIERYQKTTVDSPAVQNPKEHEDFFQSWKKLSCFLQEKGSSFVFHSDRTVQAMKEKIIDMLGTIRIMAIQKSDMSTLEEVTSLSTQLFDVAGEASIDHFAHFIQNSRSELEKAYEEKKRIVFVMGHKNPDTDTVISALAEAYRNHLLDSDTVYVPVVQGGIIPDEVKELLGKDIYPSVLLTDENIYEIVKESGQARWIMVDHNVSDIQRFAISIIDHHLLSSYTRRHNVAMSWEMAGSTTALILQKFHGLGIRFDPALSRIFYGATLMDTENRSPRKMTYKDTLIMDELRDRSSLENETIFFQNLMSNLLNTENADLLFHRDYKQDWGIFGFAVAKVKGVFNPEGEVLKKELFNNLVTLAQKNNLEKNFPLTIVKVADYKEDNEIVNRERIYLIFNDYVLPEFKQKTFEFIERVIGHEFQGKAKIARGENYIDFWGVGDQLSRKVTAPFFEPLVRAYNEYFYSKETGLYVGREFLTTSEQVQNAADKLGIHLSYDDKKRVNFITYTDAKRLVEHLGLEMMSAPQYWRVLKEAEATHDEQMSEHLRAKDFVEFLDTVIRDTSHVIHHPFPLWETNLEGEREYDFLGDEQEIAIPEGSPGLMYPRDIDLDTGFPAKVYSAQDWTDKENKWRYWKPDKRDSENKKGWCISTRGHIFLLKQTAFDNKIYPYEQHPHLGIRPCCKKVIPPEVRIMDDEKHVWVDVRKK